MRGQENPSRHRTAPPFMDRPPCRRREAPPGISSSSCGGTRKPSRMPCLVRGIARAAVQRGCVEERRGKCVVGPGVVRSGSAWGTPMAARWGSRSDAQSADAGCGRHGPAVAALVGCGGGPTVPSRSSMGAAGRWLSGGWRCGSRVVWRREQLCSDRRRRVAAVVFLLLGPSRRRAELGMYQPWFRACRTRDSGGFALGLALGWARFEP